MGLRNQLRFFIIYKQVSYINQMANSHFGINIFLISKISRPVGTENCPLKTTRARASALVTRTYQLRATNY